MNVEVFLRNKLERQIKWNGQPFKFIRYKRNDFHEITDEVEKEFNFNGVFHEGGGYGGMLNIEMYGRDGGKTVTKMKPMVLALYEDSVEIDTDDYVNIGDYTYKVVEKNDIKNLHIAFEISLEVDNGR
jgi:hypothetical protein